jgi:hypothetical protein
MLISPLSNPFHQWQQKQQILDQLAQIADLPITSKSQQRKQLQQQFSDLIFEQSLDPLFGGLVIEYDDVNNRYQKPLLTNIYLAEMLIAADQVFYRGDFSFIGKQITDYLVTQLSQSETELIESNRHFKLKQLNCFFSYSKIKSLLNEKENQLLLALTSLYSPKYSNTDGLLIAYCRSLREAADRINMHYKEAQILEFSLLQKLKTGCNKENDATVSPIENSFEVNCELLVLLSKCLVNKYDPLTAKRSKKMFDALNQRLNSDSIDRCSLLNLIYSGIILLQVDFDLEIVATIDRLTLQLAKEVNLEKPNKKSEYQENIIRFFQQRNHCDHNTSKIQMLFLAKDKVDLDSRLMEIKARFDPYRLIFLV